MLHPLPSARKNYKSELKLHKTAQCRAKPVCCEYTFFCMVLDLQSEAEKQHTHSPQLWPQMFFTFSMKRHPSLASHPMLHVITPPVCINSVDPR